MGSLSKILMVLLSVVFLFVLIGFLAPTQRSTTEIEVFAKAKHCWNVYHDSTLTATWMEDFIKIEALGQDGLSPGNQFKLVMKGKQEDEHIEIIETIEKIYKYKIFEISYTNEFQVGYISVHFKPTDLGTIISTKHEYTGKQFYLRSLLHFLNKSVEKSSQLQNKKLKKLIEETPTSRYN